MNAFAIHDELYWNAIGDEWTAVIDRATVRVELARRGHRGRVLTRGPRDRRQPCDAAARARVDRTVRPGSAVPRARGSRSWSRIDEGSRRRSPADPRGALERRAGFPGGRRPSLRQRRCSLLGCRRVRLRSCGRAGATAATRARRSTRSWATRTEDRARTDRGGRRRGAGGVRAARGHQARAGRHADRRAREHAGRERDDRRPRRPRATS